MMKSQEINERIFNELKEISRLYFDFKEEYDPTYNVSRLAKQMRLYPSDMINTTEIAYEYNPEIIGKSNYQFKTSPKDGACLYVS